MILFLSKYVSCLKQKKLESLKISKLYMESIKVIALDLNKKIE